MKTKNTQKHSVAACTEDVSVNPNRSVIVFKVRKIYYQRIYCSLRKYFIFLKLTPLVV